MPHQQIIWTALKTEHKSEGLAARSIVGIDGVREGYNPLYRERARRGVRRILPVLTGYLLARVDQRRANVLGEVARAKGVTGMLGRVRDEDVARLRGLEGSDGYVSLEGEEPPAFAFGESALLLSGMFRDQVGEYRGVDPDNERRAKIAMEILGCIKITSVPRYDLARFT